MVLKKFLCSDSTRRVLVLNRIAVAHFLAAFLVGFLFIPLVPAAEFFDSEEVIAFRLEAPIKSLKRQRGDKVDWLEGKVIYSTPDVENAVLNVKLEARGNFRRMRENCSFPPYWLNFRKSEVKGTPFAGLDKVKVVSHCNKGWKSYEPYMYTEYLVYKTYNLLTDLSFQVRLASIDYYNTNTEKEEGQFGAFFIEDVDAMEDRLSVKQVKDKYILPSRYDHRDLCIAEMFMFMIANTDFSFYASEDECCHNAKVFGPKGEDRGLFPVPYDFDMSGLVKPPYAKPDPNFPIFSVKERLYRGVSVEDEILDETLSLYFSKKDEIYDLWRNFDYLSEKDRENAVEFIDGFYRIFDPNRRSNRLAYTTELRHIGAMERSIQESIDEEARKKAKAKLKKK